MIEPQQFAVEGRKVVVEAASGTLYEGDVYVDEVTLYYDDTSTSIGLDEEVEWANIDEVLITQMAGQFLDDELEEEEDESITLPPAGGDGGETAVVGQDTKIYELIKAYSQIGPATIAEAEEQTGIEDLGSQNGNATWRGFVESVATDGNRNLYHLTKKGWVQVISHEGLPGYEPETDDEDEADEDEDEGGDDEEEGSASGLDAFTSDDSGE